MKNLNLLATVALGVALYNPSFAQEETERDHPRRGHMLEKLDANGDQAIDEGEFLAMGADRFQKADLNGDGAVTAEEAEQAAYAAMEARIRERIARQVARRMERLDANGDGRISREESEAGSRERFAHMDRNDDGVLNRDDRRHGKHSRRHKDRNKD